MDLLLKILKVTLLVLLAATKLLLKFVAFVVLAFFGGHSNEHEHKSVYMMNEEDTDEMLDDGMSLGYELDNPLKPRNYP